MNTDDIHDQWSEEWREGYRKGQAEERFNRNLYWAKAFGLIDYSEEQIKVLSPESAKHQMIVKAIERVAQAMEALNPVDPVYHIRLMKEWDWSKEITLDK